ncbi:MULTISPECIES: GvpL/GvpF family gas vesicle protein [Amycolatopsis]|uniref:GvpL/GvpF family gas vesicle protein n=1 Tax=Amycolatopsis tucumanensis TaxID=401106 RepID=A0ABP7HM17_9PSEU|nr:MULTISPECIES: GvpL/GvpF family gas vesicle protein [Amycolatopsis]MCF6420871.1 GvpL/GvpF family gas vesicle protein [Amycolatopsis tucumanensis]
MTEVLEDSGIWLYAVARRENAGAAGELRGVAGEALRAVEAGELAAVVGDVPLETFGEEALHRNLEDLDWLGAVARAHDAVVGALAGAGPVVPVRLATVYRDEHGVRRVLEHRGHELARTLDRVAGRTEWGVKVFLEEPPPAGRAETPSRRGAGTAYLARRRAERDARADAERLAREQAAKVHSRLAALAAGARLHPLQSKALSGDDQQMVLNAAYLVGDDDARAFAEAVAACDDDSPAIRVQLTGPWPPYSFSSLEET